MVGLGSLLCKYKLKMSYKQNFVLYVRVNIISYIVRNITSIVNIVSYITLSAPVLPKATFGQVG